MAATTTTFQVGTYNPITDAFTLMLDLNDRQTFYLHAGSGSSGGSGSAGLKMDQPEKVEAKAFNIRTPGEYIARVQYKNRTIQASVWIRSTPASTTSLLSSVRSLLSAIEHPPYVLRIQLPGGTQYSYADVVHVTHNIPTDAQTILAGAITHIEMHFECLPFFRGDRVTLSNLIVNPGFEAPSGPPVTVFNDTFANFNAYVSQQYQQAVAADSPLRYYRMQEVTGSAAMDSGSAGQNGTYTGGFTLGQTGICGGASFGALFNGTSGYLSCPTTGLPTGNSAFTLECWLNVAAIPGAVREIIALGTNTTNEGVNLQLQTSGKVTVQFVGGSAITSAAALSTSAWHQIACTWDGTTFTLYVDGASTGTPITPGAANIVAGVCLVGANFAITTFLGATFDEVAVYSTALSSARILAHYNAGAPTALAQGTSGFPDAVDADSPLRYYRLDESSGTTVYDAGSTQQNGTTHGSPTQGVASLLTGDTDTCYTLAAASSQYISASGTGLPQGAAAVSLECWFKFASNPASTQVIFDYGQSSGTNNQYLEMQLTSAGLLQANVGSGTVSSTALATATAHHAVATYDGTTLRLYVDGSSVGTPITPTQNIPNTASVTIGVNNGGSNYFSGQVDECAIYSTALSAARILAHYNAGHNSPTATANTMLLPAGCTETFGSPAWGPINTWALRWRYVSGLTATFHLHWTNASNYLAVVVTGTQMQLVQTIAGTQHVLATVSSLNLVNGVWYWLNATQFPNYYPGSGNAGPMVQAALYSDSAGAINTGAQIGSTAGPAQTFDGSTAQTGVSALQNAGASLTVGGNFTGVHTMGLFGPGGWTLLSTGTGTASGAWDQLLNFSTSLPQNGYYGGPTTSFGSGRIDAAGAGTLNAEWLSASATSFTSNISNYQTGACPVATAGDVLGASVYVATSALSAAHGSVSVYLNEYDSSGNYLRQTLVGSVSGNGGTTAYAQVSGSVTTGANCAYAALALLVADASSTSPSATVWFDNTQVWDQTATGMTTMPYCELRFGQSPAMLLVSGLLGDVAAPTFLEMSAFIASLAAGAGLTMLIGRRAQSGAGAQLISYGTYGTPPLIALDSSSYGGFYISSGAGKSNYNPGPNQWVNVHVGRYLGTYHMISRGYTSQATFANVTTRVDNVIGQSEWAGAFYTPYSVHNAWQVVDSGQIVLPPAPSISQANLSLTGANAVAGSFGPEYDDSTGGGSEMRQGWGLLLPMDAETVLTALNNPGGGSTLTNQWFWLYCDGTPITGPTNALSYSSSGVPAPATAANVAGTTAALAANVQMAQDAYLQVDPTLSTVTSQTNQGVNFFGAVAYDASANIYPLHCYLSYSPRYLYPR